jgi:putative salt-induced outer membrane protein
MKRLNKLSSLSLITLRSLSLGSLLSVALPQQAVAQEEPKSLLGGEKATAGSEDVATTGFEAVAKAEESPDTLEIKLSAGGLSTGGNAESLALTAASKLHYRHDANQLSGAVVGNYGRAKPAGAASTETTVENLQGKIRYDRFITKRVALFGAVSILTNRFLGLDYRLNLDPGLAYYFVDEAKHRMWAEIGYDLQYDLRREDVVAASIAAGTPLDRSELSHNGRLFVGYENNLSETFALDTGLEYLQRLSETENWRLNWDLGLTSKIAGNFSLATTFNLRYDNNPLQGIKKTDYTTAISLVYQLL